MDNNVTSEINKTAEEKASEEAIRAVETMKAAMAKQSSSAQAVPVAEPTQEKEIPEAEAVVKEVAKAEPQTEIEKTEAEKEEEAARALSASEEAIRAVEAMKAAAAQTQTEDEVYIAPGVEWRKVIKTLESEVEKELGKANAIVNDVIAKEKLKCSQAVSKEFADKEAQMVNAHSEEVRQLEEECDEKITTMTEAHKAEVDKLVSDHKAEVDKLVSDHKEEVDKLTGEHEAELEKMKTLYAQQLEEVQVAFREKTAGFRKEIDHYKEQIEILMLHIDDPFVLQEIQMKQKQETN